jgi:hypothetical protein
MRTRQIRTDNKASIVPPARRASPLAARHELAHHLKTYLDSAMLIRSYIRHVKDCLRIPVVSVKDRRRYPSLLTLTDERPVDTIAQRRSHAPSNLVRRHRFQTTGQLNVCVISQELQCAYLAYRIRWSM